MTPMTRSRTIHLVAVACSSAAPELPSLPVVEAAVSEILLDHHVATFDAFATR